MIAVSGGTAFAASKLITGKQIAKGTITAANITSHSLLADNFKAGQLPTGATGATGPQGPAGATGAAGSAVAYGDVVLNGVGNPVFSENFGFTTVTEPQLGIFCVVPPAGDASLPPIVSAVGGNNGEKFAVVSPQQCAGDFEIADEGGGGDLTSGQGFAIELP